MTIKLKRGATELDLMSDGLAVIAHTWDVREIGRVAFDLTAFADTADDATTLIESVITWIRDAELAAARGDEWVELVVARGNTDPVYFDVTGGLIRPLGGTDRYGGGAQQIVRVELATLDYPRGESYSVTATATLTNGAIQTILEDVPGDVPALLTVDAVDVSTAGVINRLTLFASGDVDAIAAGDLDPWVDAPAAGSAANQADSDAVGGQYAHLAITSTSAYSAIAGATMPAGSLNKGRKHIFARVYDPATAIGAPSSLALANAGTNPRIVQIATAQTGTSGSTQAATWEAATLDDSFLIAVAKQSGNNSHSLPSPWVMIDEYYDSAPTALKASIWAIENSPSRSGSETVTFGASAGIRGLELIEIAGVREEGALVEIVRYIDQSAPAINSGTIEFPETHPMLVLGVYTYSGNNDNNFGTPTGGFTEHTDADGYQTVYRVVQGALPLGTIPAVSTTSTNGGGGGASTVNWHVILQAPLPSETNALDPGGYDIRVAAVDASGGMSDATASQSVTVPLEHGAIAATWAAPASGTVAYYRLTIDAPDGAIYLVTTPDDSLSYTIRSLADAREVTALDSESGETVSLNRFRAAIGISGGTLVAVGDGIAAPAASAWYDVLLAADIELPPQRATIAGTRPDWAIQVQAINASGVSSDVRVDALWLPPADGSFCILEIPGLAHGTKRRWLAETSRSGKSMTGWLRSTVDGSIVDALLPIGALTATPGDCQITGKADIAAGVSDVDSTKVTLAFTVHPRYLWQRSPVSP